MSLGKCQEYFFKQNKCKRVKKNSQQNTGGGAMVQGIVFSSPGIAPNNVVPGLSADRCDFRRWKISWLSYTEKNPHFNIFIAIYNEFLNPNGCKR